MADPIRVLIVDDSVVIRRLLSTIISEDPELEIAGIAPNGRIALQRIEQLDPDIVTLDIEMPELDGLGTLKELRVDRPKLPVVMFSTLTSRGGEATLSALALGASDYVTKPANVGNVSEGMERVRAELIPKLKGLCRPVTTFAAPKLEREVHVGRPTGEVEMVAIGSSTGGPVALSDVIGALPGNLPVPVVIVQHMPPVFTGILAKRLDDSCALTVVEGVDGMRLQPGHAYIAPGDYHMTVRRRTAGDFEIETNQGPQENYCRPAVDVLFRSVATATRGKTVAAVLTGMGHDGRDGCVNLREVGAHIIAQDQATSVVWGMPGAVSEAGLADQVLPLAAIGPALAERAKARSRLVAARGV